MNWKKLSEEKPARNDTCWVTDGQKRFLAVWDDQREGFNIVIAFTVGIKEEAITHWAYTIELPAEPCRSCLWEKMGRTTPKENHTCR